MLLTVEGEKIANFDEVAYKRRSLFKSKISVTPNVTIVPVGSLPRSEKKTKRIKDYRY